jgi:hypothetical protein
VQAIERKSAIEDEITGGMTPEELHESTERLFRRSDALLNGLDFEPDADDDDDAAVEAAVKTRLATDREYQALRIELAEELKLGPADPNPLDELDYDRTDPVALIEASRLQRFLQPSRPGEFHPEPLTEPDLSLSTYPARATARRLPPSIEHRVPPVAG